MSIKKFYELGHLDSIVMNAICDKELAVIKNILTTSCYERLTKKEKEERVFYKIYSQSSGHYDVEPFLRYIIFDYNISEENSIADIPDLKDEVKNMFSTRRLNEQLNTELDYNNQINKKLKV